MSDFREFHHEEPPVILVDHELDKIVAKERTELRVEEQPDG